MKKALLEIKNINKYYKEEHGSLHVLNDISLKVYKGEFLMLLGPSGSGKSTLLRILSGIEHADTGEVIQAPGLKIGFVFQSFALFPWLTVEENIEFGLKMEGISEYKRRQKAHEKMEIVGLTEFAKSYPRELSGGMKQRVGVARALAMEPDVIFLDEPFSALDSFTAEKLRDELLRLWKDQNLTLVMVTHLIEEAALMADRIITLTPSPAEIEATVIDNLKRPRHKRSLEFYKLYDRLENIIKY